MRHYGFPIQFVLMVIAILAVGCRDTKPVVDVVAPEVQPLPEAAREDVSQTIESSSETAEEKATLVSRVRPQVEAFCGNCHVLPRPTSSSHDEWKAEVDQGFMLYRTSGRNDLKEPAEEDVLKFFQFQAPDRILYPKSIHGYPPTPVPLRPSTVRLAGNRSPGVTNVRWIDIGLMDSLALVYCDIGSGAVIAHWPQAEGRPTERLATLFQPVHAEPCDLDHDGLIDLVVADIGEFDANDSDLGRVVWLRRKPDSEKFDTIVLQDNLSRVADVQPGDFDGDGDQDLIVAVFGWRKSGRTLLLENEGAVDGELPKFKMREIDDRHGPSHVPPVDLNGDGHLDFVALISQDHEVVEAFINDGTGTFKNEVIWLAPDPAYGSSGIQLVDFDKDGDLDVLYTNGDSFDRGPKPYHSIQWLENQGSYPYKHHPLCEMPGVLNAKAADFDADGDLDVVACSLLGPPIIDQLNSNDISSVVMLMQTSPGVFERTMVEGRSHQHLSLETGDFDKDGTVDFAVGNFLREGGLDQPDLTIWWNEL